MFFSLVSKRLYISLGRQIANSQSIKKTIFPAGSVKAKVENILKGGNFRLKSALEELKTELDKVEISDLCALASFLPGEKEFLHKISDQLEIRLVKTREEEISAQQLVRLCEIFVDREKFLLAGFCLLLENHKYKELEISDLVRVLENSNLADYRHKTLNEVVARLLAIKIAHQEISDHPIAARALAAVTRSYAATPTWAMRGLVCKAQEANTAGDISSVLVSLCHVGDVDMSSGFVDRMHEVLNFRSLGNLDQQSLAGISLALCLHGFARNPEISSCACTVAEIPEEIFDHRAVRVVVKPIDQWKKRDRKNWMRKPIPDFPRLIHRKSNFPLISAGRCARLTDHQDVPGDSKKLAEILSRVFLVALRSLGVTADAQGVSLLPRKSGSDALVVLDEETDASCLAVLNSEVPATYRGVFESLKSPTTWKTERRHLSHLSACDFLAALQVLMAQEVGNFFSVEDLTVMRLLAGVARASISQHRRKAFTKKASEEVFLVKSSLMKIAPCFSENPEILVDNQVVNFRTHLIVNDRGHVSY